MAHGSRHSLFCIGVSALFLLLTSVPQLMGQQNSIPGANENHVAGVPGLVLYNGVLADFAGRPLSGLQSVTFAIYAQQNGGSALWQESQMVQSDSEGRYAVYLGATAAGGVPAGLFIAGQARWLGIQAQGEPQQPRVLLVSVPYALKAADSDTLGGRPASVYVTREQLPAAGSQSPIVDSRSEDASSDAACAGLTSDGTATANYIAKWTAPCNLETSPIYVSAATGSVGYIGIGTTAPAAPLDVETAALTATSGSLYGGKFIVTDNPSGASSAANIGLLGEVNTSSGNANNFTNYLAGTDFLTQHYGTGTVANMYGAFLSTFNRAAGTVTNGVGIYSALQNLSTGTITNGYGIEVAAPLNSGGGVFTNYYGVYLAAPGSGITNSYGLYSLVGTNYMSGKLGIGVTAPTKSLEISGSVKLDGSGNGITYPDGSVQTTAAIAGSGTVSDVKAGTDITVTNPTGPTATVNLDTTKVPTLAASNTFAGDTNTFVTVSATSFTGSGSPAFTGNGSGLTNVNANELGGLASSAYAQLAAFNAFTNIQTMIASGGASGLGVLTVQNTDTTHSNTFGIFGVAEGSGQGVYGEAEDNDMYSAGVEGYASTSAPGVLGISTSGIGVSGSGATGGTFTSTSGMGGGVEATGANDSTAGLAGFGAQLTGGNESSGITGSSSGNGMYATGGIGTNGALGGDGLYATGGTSDTSYAGLGGYLAGGKANSSSGSGGDGVNVYGGDALYTTADNAGYGIYAAGGYYNNGAAQNYAGYFSGNVFVSGTVSNVAGGVKIDHPLDPASKYLFHASVESSEMMNIYTGNVVLDGGGRAEVQLPGWFEAENTDFRYALTAIGAPGPNLYVAHEVSGGRFSIAGGRPHSKVSWQITAVRQDAYAKAHPLQVEVEKPERERGLYIHPELYGQPREKQVDWSRLQRMRAGRPAPKPASAPAAPKVVPQHPLLPRPPALKPVAGRQ